MARPRLHNLENQKFGNWIALRLDENAPLRKDGSLQDRWICRCVCGDVKSIRTAKLLNGSSYGCVECYKKRRHKSGNIPSKLWSGLVNGAKSRGLEVTITPDYIWGLFLSQQGKCAISGQTLKLCSGGNASLDRIDSSKGYFPGNVQWVHKRVNIAKMNLTDEDFIILCDKISDHQRQRTTQAKKVIPSLEKYILVDGFRIVPDLRRSYGSWIVDKQDNRKYLDCFGNFGSQALGWNYPSLVARNNELLEVATTKIAHSDIYTEYYERFVKVLASTMPDFEKFFFIAGGALAVENTLKAAFDFKVQKLGIQNDEDRINQLDIIHFENAFHGRSGYTLSLTNSSPVKTKWYPKFPWTRVPISDTGLEKVEYTLRQNNAAAVIIEPILGEGGDIHNTKAFLETLRRLTLQYECLLIFDEVQTGFSTGKAWCYQHFNVVPDLISFGKKVQTGGFASTNRLTDDNVLNTPGRINSTFGADIVDLVRATIIMEIITSEGLLEYSAKVGDYFLTKLKELSLLNARGKGSMVAFDLSTTEERDSMHNKLCEKMLCLKCGSKSIRFRPHLSFTEEDADSAVEILKGCC